MGTNTEKTKIKKPVSRENPMNSPVIREASPEVPVVYGGKDLRKKRCFKPQMKE